MPQPELTNVEIKLKPWGREIWFAHTPHYAGKILELKKGHRYSLQYHEKKEETQYIFSGKVKFTYGPDADHLEEKTLVPGEKIHIKTGMIHRAEALEDSQIFEVSTPELDDVVKLHDDYGRSGKGNNESLDEQLASR
jgi:quercetin dioxygenase-like cupin family protein